MVLIALGLAIFVGFCAIIIYQRLGLFIDALDYVEDSLDHIERKVDCIMATLADFNEKIDGIQATIDEGGASLAGIKSDIADLKAQLASGGLTAAEEEVIAAKIDALSVSAKAHADALKSTDAENPAPTPEPEA